MWREVGWKELAGELAPDLVDAAIRGALPRTVTLLGLLRDGIPACWQAQQTQIFG